MIDKCCTPSDIKYHSLSYWSIAMTSTVEFLTSKFHVPNRYEKSFQMAWPTRKKIKDF